MGIGNKGAAWKSVYYMVLAALCFSLMTLFVKLAGRRLPSIEIVFLRGLFTVVFSLAALARAGLSPWGRRRGLLLLRGAFGFGALCCLYYAVTRLPLADATVIQYTNPVFTALLAAYFLGERSNRLDALGTALSLAGVVVVAQPSFLFGSGAASLPLGASAIALLGAMLSGAAYVTVRKLRRLEPEEVIIFYFPLVVALGAAPFAIPVFVWPSALEWLYVAAGVSLAAQIGQICLTRGLGLAPAGRAMALSYLQIVFAALWGALLLSETPTLLTAAGAALVAAGSWVSARAGRRPADAAATTAPE